MQHELQTQWYAKREFLPEQCYDMRGNKKVNTKHIRIFYTDKLENWELWYIIRYYMQEWYAMQEAAKKHKSIPELSHIHFILELEEPNTFTYPI